MKCEAYATIFVDFEAPDDADDKELEDLAADAIEAEWGRRFAKEAAIDVETFTVE